MKKEEFLRELEYLLSDLPDDERAEAVRYYRDYLDEAGRQDEDAGRLGSPEKVAAEIRAGLSENGQGEFTERGYQDERFQEAYHVPDQYAGIVAADGKPHKDSGSGSAKRTESERESEDSGWASFEREGKSCREEWSKWRKERERRFERARGQRCGGKDYAGERQEQRSERTRERQERRSERTRERYERQQERRNRRNAGEPRWWEYKGSKGQQSGMADDVWEGEVVGRGRSGGRGDNGNRGLIILVKRMTKLLLGAASVFGVIGGAFCIASFCLGFSGNDFAQVIQSGRSYAAAHPSGVNFSQLTQDDIEFEQSYQGMEIDELSLDISAMECRMIPWEREEWKVTGYRLPSDFKCRESGGVLEIKSGDSQFLPWNSQKENAFLEILFPENAVLNGLEIDSGVGDILMEEGVLVCGEADVDCGIGNCTLRMDVRDELKIECGVGDVSLLIAGAETDFDYKLDCGVGDITVNKGVRMPAGNTGTANTGNTGSGDFAAHEEEHLTAAGHGTDHQDLNAGTVQEEDIQSSGESATYGTEYAVSGAKRKVDHGADRKVKISCGVGSVTLTFAEMK